MITLNMKRIWPTEVSQRHLAKSNSSLEPMGGNRRIVVMCVQAVPTTETPGPRDGGIWDATSFPNELVYPHAKVLVETLPRLQTPLIIIVSFGNLHSGSSFAAESQSR